MEEKKEAISLEENFARLEKTIASGPPAG